MPFMSSVMPSRMAPAAAALTWNSGSGRETQLTALRYAQLSAIQLNGGLLKDAEESVVHSLNSFQALRTRPVQEDHQYAIRLAVQLYTTLRRSAEAERYRQLTR